MSNLSFVILDKTAQKTSMKKTSQNNVQCKWAFRDLQMQISNAFGKYDLAFPKNPDQKFF